MADEQTIVMVPLDRRADVGSVDPESRTAELVFSTVAGGDVLRRDWTTGEKYIERLSLDPKHVTLDRLNSGRAPLLNAHSAYAIGDVIGVVEADSVKLLKAEARAVVRFSKRADVEPIFQDVRDGIIRNVSVGYRVTRFEPTDERKDNIPVRLATAWEPYEISMVPMGADSGAHVRQRSTHDVETFPCVFAREPQEDAMPENVKTEPTPDPPANPPVDVAAVRKAERARITGIETVCRTLKLDAAFAAKLIGEDVTLDKARELALNERARLDADAETDTRSHGGVTFGEDAQDKTRRGVMNWLFVRSGLASLVAQSDKVDERTIDPGEFRGLSLVEVARHFLEARGIKTRGLDKMKIVSLAFTTRDITQSTSDFAYALENTMHKVLQAAYAVTPDTWSKWCKRGTVSDFRAHNRYRMGSFGALDTIAENGEFKSKSITDAEKASITAATKGNKINVSRQMVINDDMGVFSTLLTGLGRAAALSVEVSAYASLAENAGLGPTVGSAPMFDATHANIGTGAALSAAAIDADAALMARQTDKDGNDYLDLQPAVLLVERALRGTALSINEAQYDPDTANKLQKPNSVRGMFRDVVATPRFSSGATRRYLFADPNVYPCFEVAFLEGAESPVLESQDGWNTDGTEMRVRFDYGVAGIDYRGAVTNAGA